MAVLSNPHPNPAGDVKFSENVAAAALSTALTTFAAQPPIVGSFAD